MMAAIVSRPDRCLCPVIGVQRSAALSPDSQPFRGAHETSLPLSSRHDSHFRATVEGAQRDFFPSPDSVGQEIGGH